MSLARRDVLALPLVMLALRASSAFGKSDKAWPTGEWERVNPDKAGWNLGILAQAQSDSQAAGTASLMIVHHGQVVASWGEIDRRLELHSVRKSLLSALFGIAVAHGQVNLDATLASLGIDDSEPSLSEMEKEATVRQLLEARSGVYHPALYETAGEKRRRPSRGSHPPGTFWYYNNWDFNALGTIYERAVGKSIFESFDEQIAGPIGMQDYRVQDGRYIRGADSIHPAYPFQMSARDLARFGLLYLRSGRWEERQIVPAEWVKESTTGKSETYLNSGYGYLWWTGFPDRRVEVMDLAPGGFWADGHNGQYIVVDPSNDLVVVHQTQNHAVSNAQMGHLMYLILTAAGAADVGRDPSRLE